MLKNQAPPFQWRHWQPAVVAISLGVLLAGWTLEAKEYKVGYIDSEVIIDKYEAAKDAKEELAEATAEYRAEAESLRQDWQKAKDEYDSQELTLSEEGKRAKQAEVQQRKSRYDDYVGQVYRTGGKIDQKNKELIAPIVEKINEAVTKLAEEEGFALVLDASKSEVVYAQLGLDITELVVEELNREFGPVGPTVEEERVFAIMPIFEENDEARQASLGRNIRLQVYDRVRSQPKTDMVTNPKVDEQLTSRYGEVGRQLELTDALDVARVLNADYVIFGKCLKEDRRYEFELEIAEVRLNQSIATESGEASRDTELTEKVAEVVQRLVNAIGQQ